LGCRHSRFPALLGMTKVNWMQCHSELVARGTDKRSDAFAVPAPGIA